MPKNSLYTIGLVVLVTLVGIGSLLQILPASAGHGTCWDVDSCSLSHALTALRTPADAAGEFCHSWAGPNHFYRPFLSIEEWMLWNAAPDRYRLEVLYAVQLLLHVTGAVLFMYTLTAMRVRKSTAIWSACLFGGGGWIFDFLVLPTPNEGLLKPFIDLPEPWMLNVICVSTLLFVRYWQKPTRFRAAACLMFFLFGLLNKESEAVMPIIWFVSTFAPGAAAWPPMWKDRIARAAQFAAVILFYIAVRTVVLHGAGAIYHTGGVLHRLAESIGGTLVFILLAQNLIAIFWASAILMVVYRSLKIGGRFSAAVQIALAALSIISLVLESSREGYGLLTGFEVLGARLFLVEYDSLFLGISAALYTLIVWFAITLRSEWPIQIGAVWTACFTLLWLPMETNHQAEYLISAGWAIIIGTLTDLAVSNAVRKRATSD